MPCGSAASGAPLQKGSKTQSVPQMVPMPTTNAGVLCRCCPSAVKAWLGLVKQIYLDWFLNKIQSDSKHQIHTILTLEVTKDQRGQARLRGQAACIRPARLTDINEGTVWSNATSTFLTNQEWRLTYMSPIQTNTTHNEQAPALHVSSQIGKQRVGV